MLNTKFSLVIFGTLNFSVDDSTSSESLKMKATVRNTPCFHSVSGFDSMPPSPPTPSPLCEDLGERHEAERLALEDREKTRRRAVYFMFSASDNVKTLTSHARAVQDTSALDCLRLFEPNCY